MTALLLIRRGGDIVGQCDAKCYEAKHSVCTCVCEAANHQVGREQAVINTRAMAEGWVAKARADGQQIDSFELDLSAQHEPLFPLPQEIPMADPPMFGPYDSEEQTYSEPMPLTIRTLRDSGRMKSGDPDGISRDVRVEALMVAIEDAGVELGEFDRRIVRWLGEWEPSTVQVLIGIISRAGASCGQ